jgi:hypothetical protein
MLMELLTLYHQYIANFSTDDQQDHLLASDII